MITVSDLIEFLSTHHEPTDVLYSVNVEKVNAKDRGENSDVTPELRQYFMDVPVQGKCRTKRIHNGIDYSPEYTGHDGYMPYTLYRKGA